MATQWATRVILASSVVLGSAGLAGANGGPCYGNTSCYWWGSYPQASYAQDRVPYYALYPPVYYSHVVPRAYGYSPFAYPPGILTPETRPSGGDFSPPASQAPASPPRPLRITNPYVVRSEEPVEPESPAAPAPPKPRVVFPSRQE